MIRSRSPLCSLGDDSRSSTSSLSVGSAIADRACAGSGMVTDSMEVCMTSPRLKLVIGAVVLLCAFVFANTPGSQAQEPEGNYGVGIPEVFLPKYLAYREGQLASSDPDVMRIPLGYVKGLSTSFTSMAGEATV